MSERKLPGYGAVFHTQFLHLMKSWYAPTVLIMPLLGLWWTHRNRYPGYEQMPPWSVSPLLASSVSSLLFVGMLAGILLWLSEPPSKRRYHWSLPVSRNYHDLIRVAAGAAWLIIAVVLFYAVSYMSEPAWATDNYLRYAYVFYLGALLATMLVFFMSAIAALIWDKALFWVGLIVFAGVMLDARWVQRDFPQLLEFRHAMMSIDEPWSLGSALGGFEFYGPWTSGERRIQVFHDTQEEYFDRKLKTVDPAAREVIRQRELGFVQRRSMWYPDEPRAWGSSLLLWYTLTALMMLLAVRRRPNV